MVSDEGNPCGTGVRIPIHSLADVELRHMVSQRDQHAGCGTGGTITGLSEWVGSWRDHHLSIGWDWAVIGGAAVLVSPNEIRTNIELVFRDGTPAPRTIAQIHFVHWIETLPWRACALDQLLASDCGPSRLN